VVQFIGAGRTPDGAKAAGPFLVVGKHFKCNGVIRPQGSGKQTDMTGCGTLIKQTIIAVLIGSAVGWSGGFAVKAVPARAFDVTITVAPGSEILEVSTGPVDASSGIAANLAGLPGDPSAVLPSDLSASPGASGDPVPGGVNGLGPPSVVELEPSNQFDSNIQAPAAPSSNPGGSPLPADVPITLANTPELGPKAGATGSAQGSTGEGTVVSDAGNTPGSGQVEAGNTPGTTPAGDSKPGETGAAGGSAPPPNSVPTAKPVAVPAPIPLATSTPTPAPATSDDGDASGGKEVIDEFGPTSTLHRSHVGATPAAIDYGDVFLGESIPKELTVVFTGATTAVKASYRIVLSGGNLLFCPGLSPSDPCLTIEKVAPIEGDTTACARLKKDADTSDTWTVTLVIPDDAAKIDYTTEIMVDADDATDDPCPPTDD